MFKQVLAASALVASSFAAFSNDTVITTDITVTDYTTYCPASTVITITKCDAECYPTAITVTEATTLTVTGECVVPTTYTSAAPSSEAAPSTVAAVSSFEGAGNKAVVGAMAGVAAVAAALI